MNHGSAQLAAAPLKMMENAECLALSQPAAGHGSSCCSNVIRPAVAKRLTTPGAGRSGPPGGAHVDQDRPKTITEVGHAGTCSVRRLKPI